MFGSCVTISFNRGLFLQFLRQPHKLFCDVYKSAYVEHDSQSVDNIAQSPQKDEAHSISFTKDQYNGLLAMLQKHSVGIGESSTPSNGINMIHASSHHVISGSRCFSLHTTATNHNSVPWFLDMGATHICCNLDLYTSHARITPMNINLPNGHTVVAHFSGTV